MIQKKLPFASRQLCKKAECSSTAWSKLWKGRGPHGYTLNKDKYTAVLLKLAFVSLFVVCILGYRYYSHSDIVNIYGITTVHNCVVNEPVRYESPPRKYKQKQTHFYVYKFEGHNLKLRFLSTYYDYAQEAFIDKVKVGDTVSIQIFKHKLDAFNDQYSAGAIEMVNLGINGKFIIDHNYRNTQINKRNRGLFHTFLAVFAGFSLILLFKQYYHYRVYCEQIEKEGNNW